MNGQGGYATICAALGALPATAAEAATAANAKPEVARNWLMHLERMEVLRIAAKRRVGVKHFVAVYDWAHTGNDSLPPVREPKRRAQPDAGLIHMAALIRELQTASTVRELSEATGFDRRSLHRILDLMREANIARIGQWVRVANGWAPAWQLGRGRNAAKPAPLSRSAINAKAWAARRERLAVRAVHSALTAPACQMGGD